MGSDEGVSEQKILDLEHYAASDYYDPAEKVALEYADAITLSDRDVSDELFARVQEYYDENQIVELTATICWENASSRFNRALRIDSQNLWKRSGQAPSALLPTNR